MSLFTICHHGTHSQIWTKRYGSYLNKRFQCSLPLRPERNYAVILCNIFTVILFGLILALCCSFEGPCDIKSLKISTAYDVRFSRYRPSNLIVTTDSQLAHVFKNFPDSKVHGANMGPPGSCRPQMGPMLAPCYQGFCGRCIYVGGSPYSTATQWHVLRHTGDMIAFISIQTWYGIICPRNICT